MRGLPRMSVSSNTEARADCGSLEGLRATARTVPAEAVLGGRVFTDDRSGLMVLPYMLVNGANNKVAFPVISVPRGDKPDVAAKADIDATVFSIGRRWTGGD